MKEQGRVQAKKNNYGDTISTKIETSVIVQKPLISVNELSFISPTQTQIYGNVKALIPLARERLALEFYRKGDNLQPKYRRGELVGLKEPLIFGLVTRNQVGHIPSVDVCFTEDEQNFIRDTYLYRSLRSKGLQLALET